MKKLDTTVEERHPAPDSTKTKAAQNEAMSPMPKNDDELARLSSVLLEIEPPFGVLRPSLTSKSDFAKATTTVSDCISLLNSDLPAAATALGQPTLGLTFQALLGRASEEESEAKNTTLAVSSGAMYASRDDRAAGAALDLNKLPGGISAATALAARTGALVRLLRIKLEDDGDLAQARKTLRDCRQFFDKVRVLAGNEGCSDYEMLARIRAAP